MDLNIISIIGRLTKDPVVKDVGEKKLVKISIAVNGYKEDDVSYFDIEIWGKQGENVYKYCIKGKQISVLGRLKQDRWKDGDIVKSKVKIVAEQVQFLGGKND